MTRIIEFFGLRRSMVALLSMVVLVGLGERMAERFLPVYLMAIGGGILTPGFLNALDNLLSALYSFPGGYLSDKLGHKRALLVFNLVAMAGYLIVIFIPTWQAVFVGSFFFISWTALSLPATMSLVSAVLPKNKRTMGVSMHSLVRRVPMALGPIIGGLLIGWLGRETGVRWAFVGAFILGLVALVMQQTMIDEAGTGKPAAEGNPFRLLRFMSPQLRVLLAADILIRFCEQIPYAYVVLWAMDLVKVSAFDFGILTTVEMATAMLIYVPVAYLADRGTKKPFVVMTFINFTLFPLVLLVSHSFWLLVLAFFVRGMKEFGEPTRKALIMDLAPEDRKAGMFGLYYLLRDVVVSIAPFAGAYLWRWSPEANLITASACGAAGTLFFALFGRNAKPAEAA
ncbi:MFS transporter [bacterium]|nr:MFS transporter [bacterium]